ncbi:thermonuclease family protein [Candidatus Daviesbacteria bacterium]|nr:thermonuclease family protein [Candidatus Daviesbacteria bacterium]
MFSNTKLLVSISLLAVIFGLGLLWFGLQPQPQHVSLPIPSSTTIIQSSPAATASAAEGIEGEQVQVVKVVDGDTIEVVLGGVKKTVRLIGIDTPETVDPRRPVGCFGKEASNETKSLLSEKVVILQKDVSETDKYGRLLRYIFLPLENGQTLFVDDYLVRGGFAKVLTYPPDVKYNERFRQAEKEAKDSKKGLWGRC